MSLVAFYFLNERNPYKNGTKNNLEPPVQEFSFFSSNFIKKQDCQKTFGPLWLKVTEAVQ